MAAVSLFWDINMAAIVLSHKAKKKDPEISCATLQKLTD